MSYDIKSYIVHYSRLYLPNKIPPAVVSRIGSTSLKDINGLPITSDNFSDARKDGRQVVVFDDGVSPVAVFQSASKTTAVIRAIRNQMLQIDYIIDAIPAQVVVKLSISTLSVATYNKTPDRVLQQEKKKRLEAPQSPKPRHNAAAPATNKIHEPVITDEIIANTSALLQDVLQLFKDGKTATFSARGLEFKHRSKVHTVKAMIDLGLISQSTKKLEYILKAEGEILHDWVDNIESLARQIASRASHIRKDKAKQDPDPVTATAAVNPAAKARSFRKDLISLLDSESMDTDLDDLTDQTQIRAAFDTLKNMQMLVTEGIDKLLKKI